MMSSECYVNLYSHCTILSLYTVLFIHFLYWAVLYTSFLDDFCSIFLLVVVFMDGREKCLGTVTADL